MPELEGAAKTVFDVVDYSAENPITPGGVVYLVGITERGEPGKPKLARTWNEYRRYFGGILSADVSPFPLYCFFLLQGGAPLYISPAGHYTDVDDDSTLTGTPAAGSISSGAATPETKATNTFTISNAGTDGDEIIVAVLKSANNEVVIGSYTKVTGDNTPTLVAVAVKNAINAGTSVHGFTAANTGAAITVTAPTGTGAGANSYTLKVYLSAAATLAVTGANDAFATGVTLIPQYIAPFTATSNGTWANANLTVTTVAAKSGKVGYVDLSVTLTGYKELNITVPDVQKAITAAGVKDLNARLKLLQLGSVTGQIPVGTVTLSGGVRDASAILEVDFIGGSIGQTGIYSFDKIKGGRRIAIPEKASNDVDLALAAYAVSRFDLRPILRTPIGLDGATAIDYRDCTGTYSGTPVDEWRGLMIVGDSDEVKHPETGELIQLPGNIEALIKMAERDRKYPDRPWYSFSGPQRGIVKGRTKVVYNLGAASKTGELDDVDARGLYPYIDHEAYGPTMWGFYNLWKTQQLIRQDTNAELALYIYRNIKPIADFRVFDPNDPIMWRQLYLKIRPFMNGVADRRGITGKENVGWKYIGDQDVQKRQDAVFNSQQDLDAGKYRSRLLFKPIGATKFIGMEFGFTSSAISFEQILELTA